MFERTNQNILSEHYGKLVDRTGDDLIGFGDEEEDFITLKRANHELPPSLQDPNIVTENLSKRKRRALASKKALAKNAPNFASKLIFDEDGNAHNAYTMENDVEFRKGDVAAAGRVFAETERAKLKDADVQDKQLAKEKKQEKKRKRKEREAAVSVFFVTRASFDAD
jgi:ATP-dependent RNA helicase DDX10/DBP4